MNSPEKGRNRREIRFLRRNACFGAAEGQKSREIQLYWGPEKRGATLSHKCDTFGRYLSLEIGCDWLANLPGEPGQLASACLVSFLVAERVHHVPHN